MLLLAISVLVLLATANYWLERRIFYPPVVFCAVWAVDLAIVGLSGDLFFSLSEKTMAIFCCGAVAFSLGSSLALFTSQPSRPRDVFPQPPGRFLNLLVVLLAASVPFVAYYIIQLASNFNAATLLLGARMAMLETNETGEQSVLLGAALTLSLIVATIAFLESEKHRIRATVAVLVALMVNILSGGRGGIVTLGFSLVCIQVLKTGRVRWKAMAAIFVVLVLIFGVMGILVQKGEARADATFSENFRPVVEGFAVYAGGGVVGFDRVVRQPTIVPHNWDINRFFLETFNKFGARFEVPSLHAEYVELGPHYSGNVYTGYFAYIDLGFPLMMLVVFCVGFVLCLAYRKAVEGSKIAILMYAFFFSGLGLMPFNEQFFMQLNHIVKLYAVAWLVYSFPLRMSQFSNVLRRHSASASEASWPA
jgi:oligosaccharide repeat unit polymerase